MLWELKREAVLLELEHGGDLHACHLLLLHVLLPLLYGIQRRDAWYEQDTTESRVNTGVLCCILMYPMCIAYRIAHVFSMYSHHIMTCIGCTHIGMYYACIMHVFLAYSMHILPF